MNSSCRTGILEYRKFSRYYDACLNPLLDPLRHEVRRLAIQTAPGRILDICCGTGRQLKILDGLGVGLTGVDLSPDMLAVARKKTSPQVALVLADGGRLPFGDNSFEIAVVTLALHEKNATCRDELMAEARRVVAPKGAFLVADYLAGTNALNRTGLLAASLVEWAAGRQHYLNFRDFLARGALEPLLTRHGLRPSLEARFWWGAAGLFLAGNT